LSVAICARTHATPEYPIVLAFRHQRRAYGFELAWPCPFCREAGHRHERVGLQRSACGRGMYLVRSNGGRIHEV